MSIEPWINSIRTSVDRQDFYAALSVALTIPDICGKLQTPDKGVGERYKAWWTKYMSPTYGVWLPPGDAYALRCAFLHQGQDSIEEQNAREVIDRFHFVEVRWGSVHCNQFRSSLQLQVDIFCIEIADAGAQWIIDVAHDPEVQKRISRLMTIGLFVGRL